MNESDFENELRRTRPAAPSASLRDRVAENLAIPPIAATAASGKLRRSESSSAARWFGRLAWACGGAAIALVASFPMKKDASIEPLPAVPAKAPATPPDFEIVDASRELIKAQDEGLLFIRETEPQRRMRLSYVERTTWTNPETGAVIEYETPREGVVLMPVALQ
ncbi:MAG: hypothetical protein ABI680_04595 [Chthoniobacteraceae bacterium]